MTDFLLRASIDGFDAQRYIDSVRDDPQSLPNIGIAVSGGGYRALMNAAGHVAAFDSRTSSSTNSGHLGGLLQSATYLAGLSGGGWLVGSLYTNNFTSVDDIVNNRLGSVFDFENTIFEGPSEGLPIIGQVDYYQNIQNDIEAKAGTPYGYNTSITDYWGRALSYQLVNASEGGPSYTFSSIARQEFFTNGDTPLPILVADGRAPGEILISANTTVFEFNPWELGSWDPTVFGFAPLQYIGSNFSAGKLPDDEPCIAGFDNVGYVMGTSSSLFNQFFLTFNDTSIAGNLPGFLKDAVNNVLSTIGQENNDIADYSPNPFRGFNPDTNPGADSRRLTLVDGGEDLQNIPLHPLIQPLRELDVIFAVDSSADTPNGYPNGTAMVATYERSLNADIENGTAFPSIPGQQTFVNEGLNSRPTFFGCDARNYTGPKSDRAGPLVVYIPNAPYILQTNFSTFDPQYNTSERNAAIQNAYNVATQANGTIDADWPACVGCAVIQRSLVRSGTQIPEVCNTCFRRYCWTGAVNETQNEYVPEMKLAGIKLNSASGLVPKASAGILAVLLLVSWEML